MPLTNYIADQLRKHLLGTASFAKLTNVYIGLHTVIPNAAGVGAEVPTSGTGYGRVSRGVADANWTFPADPSGEASNTADIQFGAPTTGWGVIIAMAAYDAASAGNMLWYSTLTSPRTINTGDPAPKFSAGTLKAIFRV